MARTRKDSRRTGLWPLSYMGAEPIAPPLMITDNRPPTSEDRRNFNIGTFWIDRSTAPNEDIWFLANLDGMVARWIRLSAASGLGIETLTGDFGGAVGADALLNIDILGSGPYLFTGDPATWTLTLSDDGTIATQYDEDVGSAVPAANILNVLGGDHINTTGAGNTVTIILDDDIADTYVTDAGNVVAVANIINVLGGTNCDTAGAGNTITINATNGAWADSYPCDIGVAVPIAGVLDVFGGELTNTAGAANVVTVNLDRGNDGEIIIAATGAPSAYGSLTSTGGTVTITPGPNTINLETAGGVGGTKVTKFTTSGTWTKDPNCQKVEFVGGNGGGGGGSGRRGASGAAGGGSGSGVGDVYIAEVPGALAPATLPIIVAAGAAGGVPQTVDNTDGNDGTRLNYTSFGMVQGRTWFPTRGVGGINGQTLYSGGGQQLVAPRQATPWPGGCASGYRGNIIDGEDSQDNGTQGMTFYWATGGGGGGGADSVVERKGGRGGGLTYFDYWTQFLAGAPGGLESTGIDGTNGDNYDVINLMVWNGGLGGGGGGGQSVGAVAGNGGDGGIPGAGGGGGGGSLNGTDSGAGGAGGRGEVIIIEYLG